MQRHQDMFSRMEQFHQNISKQFDQMANEMFRGFGDFGGFGGGFGRNMLQDSNFDRNDRQIQNFMASGFDSGMGKGQVMRKVMHSTQYYDQNGKPQIERYESHSVGAYGKKGEKIQERNQRYENSHTGLQKEAHERSLNGQGRKVVKQRVGNESHQSEIYKNLAEEEVKNFDQRWNQVASEIKFGSKKALENPTGNIYSSQNPMQYNRSNTFSNSNSFKQRNQPERFALQNDYIQEDRRGQYIPSYQKQENQPVPYQRQRPQQQPLQNALEYQDPARRDIQPIMLPDRDLQRQHERPGAIPRNQQQRRPQNIERQVQRVNPPNRQGAQQRPQQKPQRFVATPSNPAPAPEF